MSIARVNAAVSDDVYSDVKQAAADQQTSVSALMRSAIAEGVARRKHQAAPHVSRTCPKCGGNTVRTIRSENRAGRKPSRTYECQAETCSYTWTASTSRKRKRRAPRPAKLALACPACGSYKTRVTSSRDFPIRNHKCMIPECGHAFTSVSEVIKGEPL